MTAQRDLVQLVSAAEHEGFAAARESTHADAPLRGMRDIGSFSSGARATALTLRRALIAARVPPRVLAALRPLAVRGGRAEPFDRFLRLFAFWTGVRRGIPDRSLWTAVSHGPVILMYHAIGRPKEPGSCYVVPRHRFEAQMAWLKWRRYRVVSLSDLVSALRAGRLPPARTVVITFDDGFADNADEALPVLRRYGFPATVFVVTGAIGATATWPSDPALFGRRLLTAEQIDSLIAAGIEIGAHTRTHPVLTHISPDAQDREIAGSRDDLEGRYGIRVRTFAYPFGDRSPSVTALVSQAGFDAACSSRSGVNDPATPLLALRRLEVRGTDSLFDFALLLWRAHRQPRQIRRTTAQVDA